MADDVSATSVDDVMQVLIVPPSRVMEACELYRNIFNARLVRLVNFEIPKSAFAEVQLGASVFGVTDFPFNIDSQVFHRVYPSDVNAFLANAKKQQFDVLVDNCSDLVGGGVILEDRFRHLWQVSGDDQDSSSGVSDPGSSSSSSSSSHVTVSGVRPVLFVDEQTVKDDKEGKMDSDSAHAHLSVCTYIKAFGAQHLQYCRFPHAYGAQPFSSVTQSLIESDYFGCSEIKIGPAILVVRDKTNEDDGVKNALLELECSKIADAKEIIINNKWTILRDIREDRFRPGVLLLTVMDPFNHIWQLCHSLDGLGENGYLSNEHLKVLVMARKKRDADDIVDSLALFFGTPTALVNDVLAATNTEGLHLARDRDYDILIAKDDMSGITNIPGKTYIGLVSDMSDVAAAAQKLDFVFNSENLTNDQISEAYIHALRKRHGKRKEQLETAPEVPTKGT